MIKQYKHPLVPAWVAAGKFPDADEVKLHALGDSWHKMTGQTEATVADVSTAKALLFNTWTGTASNAAHQQVTTVLKWTDSIGFASDSMAVGCYTAATYVTNAKRAINNILRALAQATQKAALAGLANPLSIPSLIEEVKRAQAWARAQICQFYDALTAMMGGLTFNAQIQPDVRGSAGGGSGTLTVSASASTKISNVVYSKPTTTPSGEPLAPEQIKEIKDGKVILHDGTMFDAPVAAPAGSTTTPAGGGGGAPADPNAKPGSGDLASAGPVLPSVVLPWTGTLAQVKNPETLPTEDKIGGDTNAVVVEKATDKLGRETSAGPTGLDEAIRSGEVLTKPTDAQTQHIRDTITVGGGEAQKGQDGLQSATQQMSSGAKQVSYETLPDSVKNGGGSPLDPPANQGSGHQHGGGEGGGGEGGRGGGGTGGGHGGGSGTGTPTGGGGGGTPTGTGPTGGGGGIPDAPSGSTGGGGGTGGGSGGIFGNEPPDTGGTSTGTGQSAPSGGGSTATITGSGSGSGGGAPAPTPAAPAGPSATGAVGPSAGTGAAGVSAPVAPMAPVGGMSGMGGMGGLPGAPLGPSPTYGSTPLMGGGGFGAGGAAPSVGVGGLGAPAPAAPMAPAAPGGIPAAPTSAGMSGSGGMLPGQGGPGSAPNAALANPSGAGPIPTAPGAGAPAAAVPGATSQPGVVGQPGAIGPSQQGQPGATGGGAQPGSGAASGSGAVGSSRAEADAMAAGTVTLGAVIATLGLAGAAAMHFSHLWGDLRANPIVVPRNGQLLPTQFGPDDHPTAILPVGLSGAYQKVLLPGEAEALMDGQISTLRGLVHPLHQVSELTTPAELYAALGLGFPVQGRSGADTLAFSRDADSVEVLRFAGLRMDDLITPVEADVTLPADTVPLPLVRHHARPWTGTGEAPGSTSTEPIDEHEVLGYAAVPLPHLAEIWRLHADGSAEHVSTYNARNASWVGATGTPRPPASNRYDNGAFATLADGNVFEIVPLSDQFTILVARGTPPAGFLPAHDGTARIQVANEHIVSVTGVTTIGSWRGQPVQLLERSGGSVLVDYAGDDRAAAAAAGFLQLNQGQWQPAWVPHDEVTGVQTLERSYPLPSRTAGPQSGVDPSLPPAPASATTSAVRVGV